MDLKKKLALLTSAGPRPSSTSASPPPPSDAAPHPQGEAAARSPVVGGAATPATSATSATAASPAGRLLAKPATPEEREARLRDLRARLSALAGGGGFRPRREVALDARGDNDDGAGVHRRATLADLSSARPAAHVVSPTPAVERWTAHGPLHVCAHLFTQEHRHGVRPIHTCLSAPARDIAALALDPCLADVDPKSLLFLDLETTGLSGGTGTLAFLIGIGFFEDGLLKVEQLFLPRPGEETPMLRYLAERCAAASCIVSYNGKAFDVPLVRTRCIINRVAFPDCRRHVDLLHWARRILRFRLPAMRLCHVEREVLGFAREDDIDGSEIPGTYFTFLRHGDGRGLARVFEHNAHDLVALAALLGHFVHGFRGAVDDLDARELLGLAFVAARAGEEERALALARAAADGGGGALAAEALELAGSLMQRRRDFVGAAELLERALREAYKREQTAARLHLRLAKLYEHRLRDLRHALAHAEQTLIAAGRAAKEKRLSRLKRKLGIGEGRLLV